MTTPAETEHSAQPERSTQAEPEQSAKPGSAGAEQSAEAEHSAELVAAVEQEMSALFRRSRSASVRLARRVHPDMDAAGYALISQIELGSDSGNSGSGGSGGSSGTGDGSGNGVRASDVAQILGLDKSTISRGITQLENLGLIERVGDPDDGRARLLRLTTSGAERYEAMRTQRQTEFRAILDRWNPDDLADLARLLGRLNTDLS